MAARTQDIRPRTMWCSRSSLGRGRGRCESWGASLGPALCTEAHTALRGESWEGRARPEHPLREQPHPPPSPGSDGRVSGWVSVPSQSSALSK